MFQPRRGDGGCVNQEPLTAFEREVLRRCIATAATPSWHPLLERQLRCARVVQRTEKTVGYYIDFEVPAELRIADMADAANRPPMRVSARHPDGRNVLDFILYVKDGAICFLEASSTGDWPDDDGAIRFA